MESDSSIFTTILLFIIALLPIVVIFKYINNKDVNKEPTSLLVRLFLGGIMSCFLVLFISELLTPILPFMDKTDESTFAEILLYSFIGVALIEEGCKFFMTYTIGYKNREFDEAYDIIVYSIFVALGFAAFENILYVVGNKSFITGITRGILSVPGHACFGLFMGYYLSIAKIASIKGNVQVMKLNIFKSILIPTVMHGTFDFCLFINNNIFLCVFVVFVIFMYINAIKKLNVVAKHNYRLAQFTRTGDIKIPHNMPTSAPRPNDLTNVAMQGRATGINDKNFCAYCGGALNGEYCSRCGKRNL